jgi:predicted Fe-Mo cluster-binding NifX family protein
MVKVALPVAERTGITVSEHFGRAPFFAFFDINEGKVGEWKVRPNRSEHFGGKGHPSRHIMSLGPEVVISMGMGKKALDMFHEEGVMVLRTKSSNIEKTLADFIDNKLHELTEGCGHSHV